VHAYVIVEKTRLTYFCLNQKKLRVNLYQDLQDIIVACDNSVATIGQRIILLSSFIAGPCHMVQNYQDAMAICRWACCPYAFITFTCNPQWPKNKRALLPKQQPQN
jgi:hypothetical protein